MLINAVNSAGRPVELFVKDGKIAAVGQDLSALAGEGRLSSILSGLTVFARLCGPALPLAHPGL